jgi:hypothetical protein
MKIHAPYEAVPFGQTKAGDLLKLGRSGWIALVIHEQDGKRVLGILNSDRDPRPYHVVFQSHPVCFRYRDGWVLELTEGDITKDSTKWDHLPGVITIGASGTTMNFAPPDFSYNELTVNLTTFEWDDVQQGAVAFPTWRIWASEADRTRPGAKPIFAFSAQATQGD